MDTSENQNPNAAPGQNEMQSSPQTPPEQPMAATSNSTSPTTKSETEWGPIIGIVIIIGLLVVGGMYYLNQREGMSNTGGPTAEEIAAEEDSVTTSLQMQSDSTSLSSIEADLNATNLEGIDAEAAKADSQLQ